MTPSRSIVVVVLLATACVDLKASPPRTEIESDVVGRNVCALSSDGKFIAIGGYAGLMSDCPVTVTEVKTGRVTGSLTGAAFGISSLEFLPTGSGVAIGSFDGSLRIWDPAKPDGTLELLDSKGGERAGGSGRDGVEFIAVSPDGKVIAESRLRRGLTLWSIQRRTAVGNIEVKGTIVTTAAFSADGRRLLVAGDEDHTPSVWKANPVERTGILLGHEKGPLFGGFSHDGKHIVTAGPSEATLRVWTSDCEIATEAKLPAAVDVVAVSPGTPFVALTTRDGITALYSIPSGKRSLVVLGVEDAMDVLDLAYSADGKHLAAIGEVRGRRRTFVFDLTAVK